MISNGLSKCVIDLQVKDETQSVVVRSVDTLVRVLREQLGLMGVKPAVNGDCGGAQGYTYTTDLHGNVRVSMRVLHTGHDLECISADQSSS
jgi:aerobic-type carbon monoxide dehydrogenase small subunit (CoxS/CutS family)